MHFAGNLLLVIAGSILAVYGVRLATLRPRPQNLAGMVLSMGGLFVAVTALAALARAWGR